MTYMETGATPCINPSCQTTGGTVYKNCRRPVRKKGYCAACYEHLRVHHTIEGFTPARDRGRRPVVVQSIPSKREPTVVLRRDPEQVLDTRFLETERETLPLYVLSQQARCVQATKARIARRDSMSAADYWRDAQPLPVDVRQRAHIWQHIMGIHGYPGMTESTCGVEPHVRAPLTLRDEAA